MANEIRITPDQMDQRANEFREERDQLGEVIRKMDALRDALREEFTGNSSEKFQEAYEELRPGFLKAQEVIEEIAKALNSTAQRFREIDGQ